ncbi:helix-turn-helix domain-containing protein [Mesorhizobium sp. CAU 1741]|uniref:helix-turn-helix domain-containing protein n=1 Tax=Mesorhizobium sp. CAU 1741 TaxID=3140366 RepID=UPI00325BCD8D
MDSLITAAAHCLAKGDPLGALKRVALREDPPALALRGIAMAQLGDRGRAKDLLKRAGRAFGRQSTVARARCAIAEAEVALVSRDLAWPAARLDGARAELERRGDRANAAHAGCLVARRLLLIGRLDEAERVLRRTDPSPLLPASRAAYELASAGIAIRRLDTKTARAALARAAHSARTAGIPALSAEVEGVALLMSEPCARLVTRDEERPLVLEDVEALLASDALVVDACRNVVRHRNTVVPLMTRPVLFALARTLAEAWPGDASRETLVQRGFRARHADESHRARLRVEIGRLRSEIAALAQVNATDRGFVLTPLRDHAIVLLAPPADEEHASVLALLADGEAWSSSALSIALGISARSVQRAIEQLARNGKVQPVGQGKARRWMTPPVPGFPTTLLLPGPPPGG